MASFRIYLKALRLPFLTGSLLPVAVATMTGYGGGNIPWIMTAVVFTSIPTILLFVAMRKFFIQGMVLSITS